MPSPPHDATVILPSLHGGRTHAALTSLAAQSLAHETIVVDNGSPEGQVTEAVAQFDFARAIRADRNLGFSRAVNLAAAQAAGRTLVIVNDDASYDPGFVERLLGALDPDAGVSMAAGVLRSERDESVIDTAGIEIDRTLLAFDYLHGVPLDALGSAPRNPFGPSGAAAAYERRAFERLDGFDERIFAYFEDLDLALRLRLAGMRCRLAPEARGTHRHSSTLGPGSRRKDYLMGFARGYLLRKWGVVNARRAPGVVVREAAICAGQALIDRNLAGVRGRREGWARAAAAAEFPEQLVREQATLSLVESLQRRAGRRATIAGLR
jgi:N-acetylglucosaminyl-diphospho-decaprenol L-rhamnosyltransferase